MNMNMSNLRYGANGGSAFAGSVLTAGPSESNAFFHKCRGCQAAPVRPYELRPIKAALAPAVAYYAPCAPPTVVNYVPQTYYRPVVVNTPVTSFQPVTSCGLCGPSRPRCVPQCHDDGAINPIRALHVGYRLMYSAAYPAYTANYVAPAVVAPAVVAAARHGSAQLPHNRAAAAGAAGGR